MMMVSDTFDPYSAGDVSGRMGQKQVGIDFAGAPACTLKFMLACEYFFELEEAGKSQHSSRQRRFFFLFPSLFGNPSITPLAESPCFHDSSNFVAAGTPGDRGGCPVYLRRSCGRWPGLFRRDLEGHDDGRRDHLPRRCLLRRIHAQ